jgi:peptide/nickel transport system substrate-binding protein
MRTRSPGRWLPLAVMIVAAVACTGGAAPTPSRTSRDGGSIVIGAEGWPRCLNPITDCAASPWYVYAVQQFVFPRLVQWSNTMEPEPSPLIQAVPSLDNGGIIESPFSVTYHLNPKAIWADGTPITCEDVRFTWLAILNATGTYSTAGYTTEGGVAGIRNVACPTRRTVRLEFNKVYVDWPDLFGGTGAEGFILEKAAFPQEANTVKPDLRTEMMASLPFSGGPWILQSWSPAQLVLVRNPRYWGPRPHLDRVTFVPRTGEAAEVSAILAGDVDAIFPHLSNVPLADLFQHNPDVKVVGGDGNAVDALWFQLDRPPMKDPQVRRAFAYAMDRDGVAGGVVGLDNPGARTNDCGPWVPGQGPWCPTDGGPFTAYQYDPSQAVSILEQDGYDCGGVAAGGFCTKDGTRLSVTISTLAGDVQDVTSAALLQQKAAAAGIEVLIQTFTSPRLFYDVAPRGAFQVILYPRGPVIDPSVTELFSCAQIPTQANGFGGGNWIHFCDKQADQLMQRSDQELDVSLRTQEIQELGRILAEDLAMLPLDVPPNVGAWRSDRIAGVDPADLSSPYGLFAGLSSWYELS